MIQTMLGRRDCPTRAEAAKEERKSRRESDTTDIVSRLSIDAVDTKFHDLIGRQILKAGVLQFTKIRFVHSVNFQLNEFFPGEIDTRNSW